ncbi:TniB family NTP-binding protein [Methylobacterium brachiatum]
MLFDELDLAEIVNVKSASFASAVAKAQHEYKLINFKNPRLVEAVRRFEVTREQLKLARNLIEKARINGIPKPRNLPQLLLAYIAPSGSGKTRNIQTYIQHVEKVRGSVSEDIVSTLYVELKPSTKVKDLLVSVLESLGDPFADIGDIQQLWERMHLFIDKKKVELIFIDEFHNLLDSDSGVPRKSVLDTMKGISNRGTAAFVLSGVEKSMSLIKIDKELISRQDGPLLMAPLDISKPDDAKIFLGHLASIDLGMMKRGITDVSSNFLDKNIYYCLYEATISHWKVANLNFTGSVVGDVSKIIGVALYYMHERIAENSAEPKKVTTRDLMKATDAWAVTLDVCGRNPFRESAH